MNPLLRMVGWMIIALVALKLVGVLYVVTFGNGASLDWVAKQLGFAVVFTGLGSWLIRRDGE